MIARLLVAKADFPRELLLFDRLSESALAEEVGPPPDGVQTWVPLYEVYYLGKKVVQGRDPSGMDWIMATADVALTFAPELRDCGKAGGTVVKPGLKQAAEQAFKTTLKQEGKEGAKKQVLRTMTRAGVRLTATEAVTLAARVAEHGLDHELVHLGVASLLSELLRPLREALSKATTIEVTQAVRFIFTYSGVRRQSLKRLTTLEARLFMRRDAKVYLRLGNTVLGTMASKYINNLNDGLTDQILDQLKEEKQAEARRKQVGAWWLANASGLGGH